MCKSLSQTIPSIVQNQLQFWAKVVVQVANSQMCINFKLFAGRSDVLFLYGLLFTVLFIIAYVSF